MILEMLEYLGLSLVFATVLIVLAKFVLQNIIRRPTDYYECRELADEKDLTSNFGKSEH